VSPFIFASAEPTLSLIKVAFRITMGFLNHTILAWHLCVQHRLVAYVVRLGYEFYRIIAFGIHIFRLIKKVSKFNVLFSYGTWNPASEHPIGVWGRFSITVMGLTTPPDLISQRLWGNRLHCNQRYILFCMVFALQRFWTFVNNPDQ
jgi:hypothetical protein